MRNILSEFGYGAQQASTLKMDNQSAISVSKNPEHHGWMKHLDVCCYWLRDKVENGVICPDFIPTLEMIADCLTKSVPAPKDSLLQRWVSWLNFFFFHVTLDIDKSWGHVRYVILTCHSIYPRLFQSP